MDKDTALKLGKAFTAKNHSAIERLYKTGIDPNQPVLIEWQGLKGLEHYSCIPLLHAISADDMELMERLMRMGADIDALPESYKDTHLLITAVNEESGRPEWEPMMIHTNASVRDTIKRIGLINPFLYSHQANREVRWIESFLLGKITAAPTVNVPVRKL